SIWDEDILGILHD
ncbi:hypothetical protein A2U01_0080397, partial [Trifolium medium]|nr:hypothetical protein [Trifolium medium]